MGWHHIPAFETDFSEPDKSNNPWKGKNPRKPTRISVAMPPDDWLCQKLERLNLTVAEGYPSRSQDSAGLRRDHFIALIHPIQWTIAYPVGADRPAKRQKKTSCVSTGRSVPSTSALARWRVVLPSCLDRVTSWHLFRLARTSVEAFS